MQMKMFEVRDRATYIPTLAIMLDGNTSDAEEYMLHRAGYGTREDRTGRYVYLINLEDGKANYDPFKWSGRTMMEAHRHIQYSWDELESGDVVDVEYILGESKFKKVSERIAEV